MKVGSRKYYERGEKLYLRRENSSNYDEWEIMDMIGEGSSSVCYAARQGSKQGRLKAYSPINLLQDREDFTEFITAYKVLDEVKGKGSRYEILNNYIAYYELLLSTDKLGKVDGAFIWTPDDKMGTDYEKYINKIRRSRDYDALRTLTDIVKTLCTLTDCISLLHSSGILHLDLKPSNFLVTYDSHMELNTGNISLFDINTIYSIESEAKVIAGSDGYCAPEVERGRADNRSDLYSIGAIFFSSLVNTDTVPDGLYRDEYYDRIEDLVKDSKIIRAFGDRLSRDTVNKITGILKNSLAARPKDRYQYAELLLKDLKDLAGSLSEDKQQDKKQKKLGRGLVLTLVLALALGLAYFLGHLDTTRYLDKTPDKQEAQEAGGQEAEGWESEDKQGGEIMSRPDIAEGGQATEAGQADQEAYERVQAFMSVDVKEKVYVLDKKMVIPDGETLLIPAGKTLMLGSDGLVVSKTGKLVLEGILSLDKGLDQLDLGLESVLELTHRGLITTPDYTCETKVLDGRTSNFLRKGYFSFVWDLEADLTFTGKPDSRELLGAELEVEGLTFTTDNHAVRVRLGEENWAVAEQDGNLRQPRFNDYYARALIEREGFIGQQYDLLGERLADDKGIINMDLTGDILINRIGQVAIIPATTTMTEGLEKELRIGPGSTLAIEDIHCFGTKDKRFMGLIVVEAGARLVVGDIIIDVPEIPDYIMDPNSITVLFDRGPHIEMWGRAVVRDSRGHLLDAGLTYEIMHYTTVTYDLSVEFELSPESNQTLELDDIDYLNTAMDWHSWRTELGDMTEYLIDRSYDIMPNRIVHIPDRIRARIADGAELRVHPGGQILYTEGPMTVGDIVNKDRIVYLTE